MKRKSILCFGVFAIVMLLGATQAVGDCVAPECMVAMGYQVRVVRDSNNAFPIYNPDGSAKYNYQITKVNGKLPVANVDMLIPNCVNPGAPPSYPNISTSPTSHSLFLNGKGDLLTGLGFFDKTNYVLKWNVYYDGKNPAPLPFSVTIKNQQAGATPTTMLLTAGAILSDSGMILGPDCNVLPARQNTIFIDTDLGTVTCQYSADGTTFSCTSPPGGSTKVYPLGQSQPQVTIRVYDPSTGGYPDGAYQEMHPYYMSEDSQSVGSGSPCKYYTRLINNQLVVVAVGSDCPQL
jgi:hypothetical protein